MINYVIKQRVNPRELEAARKFYAIAQSQGSVDLRQLATRISRESTISMMDTTAVLEGLLQVVPDLLIDGRIVKLGDLGTFRTTLSSSGSETADDFNVSMIKGLNLKFRPGKVFTDQLKQTNFARVSGD
jgi:predicted histone-like DNA-binding protein